MNKARCIKIEEQCTPTRVDTSLVILAVILRFLLPSSWQWQIAGVGTLFAMVYVGVVVRFAAKYLGWLDRILACKPGFRRCLWIGPLYQTSITHQIMTFGYLEIELDSEISETRQASNRDKQ